MPACCSQPAEAFTPTPNATPTHLHMASAPPAAAAPTLAGTVAPTPPLQPAAPTPTQDDLKRIAAHRAVDLVRSGMVLGLGTGSTAAHALDRIGDLIRRGDLRNVVGVPTSRWAEARAAAAGIPLTDLGAHPALDLAIDGADEVDPDLNLVKGRGGSHLREKMVEGASRRLVVVVDETKLVARIGATGQAVPVEVVPFGWQRTLAQLEAALEGCRARLRRSGSGGGGGEQAAPPFETDNGNYVVDLFFEEGKGVVEELREANDRILRIPGVVEHGMFLGMASLVIVACKDGRVTHMGSLEA